jgi:hypothetical protein
LQPLDHPGSGAAMAARRSDDQHRFPIACRRSHPGTFFLNLVSRLRVEEAE